MSEEVAYVEMKERTYKYVGREAFGSVVEEYKDFEGDVFVDFEDCVVIDRDLETLAEKLAEYGHVHVVGLEEDVERRLRQYQSKVSQTGYESVEEFYEMFKGKFPEGTLCIWDRSVSKEKERDAFRPALALVRIERYEGLYVVFRKYKSGKLQPKYVQESGGLDDPSMYVLEDLHISNFSGEEDLFRYPVDEREKTIVRMLESVGEG